MHGKQVQNAPTMIGKFLRGALVLVVGLAALAAVLIVANAPPAVPPVSAAEATNPSKPYVVKLHAQWCPVCMLTKDEWAEIEAAYADRVNLVVFDSTLESDRTKSRAEADRLGLRDVLDAYYGATGMVLVIDPQTRQVVAQLGGIHPLEDYQTAIDAALTAPPRRG